VSPSSRIIVTGASGFIGRALVRDLAANGAEIVALTRDPEKVRERFPRGVVLAKWNGRTAEGWGGLADRALAIVNLAGDSLAEGRWTKAKKARILASRIDAGAAVVEAVRLSPTKPRVLVQASAIGFYGPAGDEDLDERSPSGVGFLAGVVRAWEDSTKAVESYGVRRAVIRSGLVLGTGGGLWPRLVLPFRFFVGGPLGGGRQTFSWISLEDEVRAIRHLIEHEDLSGAFDLTAPGPLRQKEFCRVLGRTLRRPCWLPVPALLLRLLFGEKAKETLLAGQRVVPRRLSASGFSFLHPDAASAVRAILRGGPREGSRAG
jgi:uncharacterized protein (TIGR01777 family)